MFPNVMCIHTCTLGVLCLVMESNVMAPPPAKRPCREEEPPPPGRPQRSIAECVFRRGKELLENLNVNEVLNASITPVLTFLTPYQVEVLEGLQETKEPMGRVVRKLLNYIKALQGDDRNDACRKLVACIVHTANEERGHRELEKIFRAKLFSCEWGLVERLLREINESPMPSPYRTPRPKGSQDMTALAQVGTTESPERPVQFITLQGELGDQDGFACLE